jgi:hypothetical protein
MSEQHSHDAEVHSHEHAHVTHYLGGGQDWTHLADAPERKATRPHTTFGGVEPLKGLRHFCTAAIAILASEVLEAAVDGRRLNSAR